MSALVYIAIAVGIVALLVVAAPWAFDRLCPRVTSEPDEHEALGIGAVTHDAARDVRRAG